MVERTRAIRLVLFCVVSIAIRLTSYRIVQVPGGSRWRICYAAPATRRTYDQANVFCLRADTRRNEEVAPEFVQLSPSFKATLKVLTNLQMHIGHKKLSIDC